MRVLFFGTSPFAASLLEWLIASGTEIAAVVTKPDAPQGRRQQLASSPVAISVPSHIPLLKPVRASSPEFIEHLATYNADIFLVVAYGEILSETLLESPRLLSCNIHPSLLPKHRGASPIHAALLAGDRETGVSIIEMSAEMDAGDILIQKRLPLPSDTTFPELETALLSLSCDALGELLEQLEQGRITKQPQSSEGVSYTKKITTASAQIDWAAPVETIHNLVRALTPKPGAWTHFHGKRLKIIRSRPFSGPAPRRPGEMRLKKGGPCLIGCGNGTLEVIDLQLEGKGVMGAKAFAAGYAGEHRLEG